MSTERKHVTAPAELPAATAVRLEAQIAYQPGAIVSRTLVKAMGGTLTLFAFDAGEGLSEHTAPFDALVQVLEGAAEVTIGGERVVTRAGETVLMPATVSHALHAPERFKMLLSMVKG
jgi:quercetin dioxygenase-like cupin family protein